MYPYGIRRCGITLQRNSQLEIKRVYKEFVDKNDMASVFDENWWMDAVCGEDNWNVIIAKSGDSIIGAMPYQYCCRNDRISISLPKLTQTNNLLINYPNNQKYVSKLGYENKVINSIIDQIENMNISYFNQNFNYMFTNWLPFYWRGYNQTTRYTYVIDDLNNLDRVYNNFHYKVRNQIKKAMKYVNVKTDLDITSFFQINKKTFDRQKKDIPYSFDFIKELDEKCEKIGRRKIFYAIDEEGNVHASIYIIWNCNSAYYIMGGEDAKYRNSEAMTLLIWKAIQFASKVTRKFDFEGSMMENVESFFRGFGGIQKPYFKIWKDFTNEKMVSLTDRYKNYYYVLNRWLELKNKNLSLEHYFISREIKRIAIYGIGELGIRLLEELRATYIKVICIIDKDFKDEDYEGIPVIKPQVLNQLNDIEAIVVTPFYIFGTIKEFLITHIQEDKIISLNEIVFAEY